MKQAQFHHRYLNAAKQIKWSSFLTLIKTSSWKCAMESAATGETIFLAIGEQDSFQPYNLDDVAIVDEAIEPNKQGRVRFRGSWWPAQSAKGQRFSPGDRVWVVARRNITLLVEPID